MNRRAFLAAIGTALVAGPKALASLLERHRQRDALIFSIDFPHQFVWRRRRDMVLWSRGVEEDMIAMMRFDPHAPGGFRAWSQRHPS